MSAAPTPGRVPVGPKLVWWRIVVAAGFVSLGGGLLYRLVSGGFTWWALCMVIACGAACVMVLDKARRNACGACGAILSPAIIRLPIDLAEALAQSVTARGSLDPALPNPLPPGGAAAYTAVIGEVCPRCQRAASVHVSRYGKLPGSTSEELRVSWEPLTPETLLDEASAKFLATLARHL